MRAKKPTFEIVMGCSEAVGLEVPPVRPDTDWGIVGSNRVWGELIAVTTGSCADMLGMSDISSVGAPAGGIDCLIGRRILGEECLNIRCNAAQSAEGSDINSDCSFQDFLLQIILAHADDIFFTWWLFVPSTPGAALGFQVAAQEHEQTMTAAARDSLAATDMAAVAVERTVAAGVGIESVDAATEP
ncbi:hypothetical protein Taro_056379 [Colocasia esculenta]|uniref:Uncharacterized protein n=1 Tax=Colocasia esculenta TaxID=4460 RepID=A0A843XX53_COLES|nr:hypothetical protein [Colocasia esculenta]